MSESKTHQEVIDDLIVKALKGRPIYSNGDVYTLSYLSVDKYILENSKHNNLVSFKELDNLFTTGLLWLG